MNLVPSAARDLCVLSLVAGAALLGCSEQSSPADQQSGSQTDSQSEASARGPGAIDLSPGLSNRDLLTYEHVLEAVESRVAAPGSPISTQAQVIRQYTLQPVADEPDGGALVEFAMKRVVLSIRMPNGANISIDTDAPPVDAEPSQTRAVRSLAEIRLIIAMNVDGSVREVRGLQEAMQQIGSLPQGMGAFFDEVWFRSAVEGVYRAAEDRTSADVGDEWTVAKTSSFGDTPDAATTTYTSRLTMATDDIATIEGSALLDIEFARVELVFGGDSRIDDQLFEFQKRWDRNRGSLLEHATIQQAEMTVFYGGLQVGVSQRTASRLARLSPDGVPSAMPDAESPGTEVNPGASESDS